MSPSPVRVHVRSLVAADLDLRALVVRGQRLLPHRVPHAGHPLGRVDDVGEQDRGQHAVRVGPGPLAGEEVLDLLRGPGRRRRPTEGGRPRPARRTSRWGSARRGTGRPRRGTRGRPFGAARGSARARWAGWSARRSRRSSARGPATAAGLAPRRRYLAQVSRKRGSWARLGARASSPTGPPHSRAISSLNAACASARGAPRIVGRLQPARVPAEQDDGGRSRRVGGREQDAHGRSLRDAEQGGPVRAGGVADRAQIVHARLERRKLRLRDAVGESRCRACRTGSAGRTSPAARRSARAWAPPTPPRDARPSPGRPPDPVGRHRPPRTRSRRRRRFARSASRASPWPHASVCDQEVALGPAGDVEELAGVMQQAEMPSLDLDQLLRARHGVGRRRARPPGWPAASRPAARSA